jgi:glutaminase
LASHSGLCPITRKLHALRERFLPLVAGDVATYIPELAQADPGWFGISLATADGHVYEVGDTRQPFTIQSISKPFVYGLALEDRGKTAVLERIGVEPTGDAFNEISLESPTGRPRNPMINAGAIAASSLVAGRSQEDRWERILALFSIYAGRRLALDETVYRSERDTGHRNRAISHMLRNFGIIDADPEPALDLYFRQCSIAVTSRDLSIMGATLANGGTNPITRERALLPSNVDEVLSVMTTCGMYDYAGEWVYRVGLPAKSGVAGGILAVLPGQLGLAVFSPRLDARGNSVRGVAVCEAISDELELHFLRAPRPSVAAVRSRAKLGGRASKRVRFDAEREQLAAHGNEVVVYELQGDLAFAGMEAVIRSIVRDAPEVVCIVLDFRRVTDVDEPSGRLLLELDRSLTEGGGTLVYSDLARHPRLVRQLEEARAETAAQARGLFEELDTALEWCENRLLERHGRIASAAGELPLSKHELLQGLDDAQLEWATSLLVRQTFAAREMVVRKGDRADELFLLVDGALSVLSDLPDGRLRRLATLSPGMGFGEPSMVAPATRTAFVRADRDSVCFVMKRSDFDGLESSAPLLKIRLLENLLRSTATTLGRLSFEAIGASRP